MHESQTLETLGPGFLTPFFPHSNSRHFEMLLELPEQHPQPRWLSRGEAPAPYSCGMISRDFHSVCRGVCTHTPLTLSPTKPEAPLGL